MQASSIFSKIIRFKSAAQWAFVAIEVFLLYLNFFKRTVTWKHNIFTIPNTNFYALLTCSAWLLFYFGAVWLATPVLQDELFSPNIFLWTRNPSHLRVLANVLLATLYFSLVYSAAIELVIFAIVRRFSAVEILLTSFGYSSLSIFTLLLVTLTVSLTQQFSAGLFTGIAWPIVWFFLPGPCGIVVKSFTPVNLLANLCWSLLCILLLMNFTKRIEIK